MNRERFHLWAQDTKNLSAACNWRGGVTHLAVIAVCWPVAFSAQGGPPSLCQWVEENLKKPGLRSRINEDYMLQLLFPE